MLQESHTGHLMSGDSSQANTHTRDSLKSLQGTMIQQVGQQVELAVTHRFINGIYSREILIPAGVLVAGRIHKGEHLSVISLGVAEVVIDNVMTGDTETVVYASPITFVSPAGTKRMVLAISDVVWTTFHKHEGAPDPEGIEDVFTWMDYEAFENETLLSPPDTIAGIEVQS